MTRILFLVNGLGLGNSTRCHALIQQLLTGGDRDRGGDLGQRPVVFRRQTRSRPRQRNSLAALRPDRGAHQHRRDFVASRRHAGLAAPRQSVVADTIARFRPHAVVTELDLFAQARAPRRAAAGRHQQFRHRDAKDARRRLAGGGVAAVPRRRIERLYFPSSAPRCGDQPRLDPADTAQAGPFRAVGPIVRADCRRSRRAAGRRGASW